MKTDELIRQLAQDPVLHWPFRRAFTLALAVGLAITALIYATLVGPRPDVLHAAVTTRFLFKFVVTLSTTITAILLIARQCQPGSPLGLWRLAPLTGPILLMAAVVAELIASPASTWASLMIGSNSLTCLTLLPIMAAGPLLCILIAQRQGAPAHPGFAGATAGLLASAIAATFYASRCTDDSPLFVATWYPLASMFVIAVGYAIGARMLR
jgi:hypothetical protein